MPLSSQEFSNAMQVLTKFAQGSKEYDYLIIFENGICRQHNLGDPDGPIQRQPLQVDNSKKEQPLVNGLVSALNAKAITLLTRLYVMTGDYPKLANSKTVKEIERFFNQE